VLQNRYTGRQGRFFTQRKRQWLALRTKKNSKPRRLPDVFEEIKMKPQRTKLTEYAATRKMW